MNVATDCSLTPHILSSYFVSMKLSVSIVCSAFPWHNCYLERDHPHGMDGCRRAVPHLLTTPGWGRPLPHPLCPKICGWRRPLPHLQCHNYNYIHIGSRCDKLSVGLVNHCSCLLICGLCPYTPAVWHGRRSREGSKSITCWKSIIVVSELSISMVTFHPELGMPAPRRRRRRSGIEQSRARAPAPAAVSPHLAIHWSLFVRHGVVLQRAGPGAVASKCDLVAESFAFIWPNLVDKCILQRKVCIPAKLEVVILEGRQLNYFLIVLPGSPFDTRVHHVGVVFIVGCAGCLEDIGGHIPKVQHTSASAKQNKQTTNMNGYIYIYIVYAINAIIIH